MLNAEQILERKILKLENSKGKKAQIGYDLSVKEIKKLEGKGEILINKTNLPNYIKEEVIEFASKNPGKGENLGWILEPGYFEITFWEGCKIPDNLVGLIRQRSSMLRSGALLYSSVFDSGFETEEMGSFIAVFHPIFIEKDARIAQIYFHECEPVGKENLYNGSYQNDKQRK